MCNPIFDIDDGDVIINHSGNMAFDSNGDIMLRLSDNMALDLDSGDIHFISSWPKDEDE